MKSYCTVSDDVAYTDLYHVRGAACNTAVDMVKHVVEHILPQLRTPRPVFEEMVVDFIKGI